MMNTCCCRGGLAAAPPLPGIDTVAAARVHGRAGRLARRIDVTFRLSYTRVAVESGRVVSTCSLET